MPRNEILTNVMNEIKEKRTMDAKWAVNDRNTERWENVLWDLQLADNIANDKDHRTKECRRKHSTITHYETPEGREWIVVNRERIQKIKNHLFSALSELQEMQAELDDGFTKHPLPEDK